jgi:hypothetical protein
VFPHGFLHLIPDFVGYMCHAIGVTPVMHEVFHSLGYSESQSVDLAKLKAEIIAELKETYALEHEANHVETEVKKIEDGSIVEVK